MKRQPITDTAKLLFALAFVLMLIATPRAQAQSFGVVHNFTGGTDGANPLNGLIMDAAGNLYGTTMAGSGSHGVVYEISSTGKKTLLHAFAGKDGSSPQGLLLLDSASNLYGTTAAGG